MSRKCGSSPKLLSEIFSLSGPANLSGPGNLAGSSDFTRPANLACKKKAILKQLKQINSKLSPAGGIGDIVALAERFFDVNFDEVKPSQLEPKAGDLDKQVGTLKIKDITDNPSIDPSKAINFNGLDLSKLSKLKISLTVPTLTVVKTLAFGPVSVGIKFQISLKEIYWGPTVELDMDSIDKALAVLKKSVVTDLITPSMGKNIKDLKDLAQAQLKSSNPSAAKDLSTAQTPEDFFEMLSSLQLNLYETVNLGEKAEKIIKENEKVAELIRKKTTNEVGDKLIENGSDLIEMEHCESRNTEFAKFNKDEIAKVSPCKVKKAPVKPVQLQAIQDIKDDAAKAMEAASAAAAESQKEDLDNFLSCVNSSNTIMQDCNNKKVAAQNKQWFFREFENLHMYVHDYVSTRYSLSPFSSPFIVIIKERERLEKVKADQAKAVDNPPIGATPAVIQSNIEALANTNTAIADLNVKFKSTKDDLKFDLEAKLNEFPLPLQTAGNSNFTELESFKLRLLALRSTLLSELNPITNLVGFNSKGELIVYINPSILADAKKIEQDAKAGTPSEIFQNYVRMLDFDFRPILNSDNDIVQPKIRKGVLETGVWKKYYSTTRIDDLFTWQEQGYTAPKQQFDNNGNLLGTKVNVEIVNGLGAKTVQEVPQSAKECEVDLKVAVPFLENLEANTTSKVLKLIQDVNKGAEARAFLDKLQYLASLEAQLQFYVYISSVNFNIELDVFQNSVKKDFENAYQTSLKIYEGINNKIKTLQDEIDKHAACVETQQKNIENCAKDYANKTGNSVNSNNIMKKCKDKLGSDPVGNEPSTGECPTYIKNCYWTEYTKLLQTVSLMPIPELNPIETSKRLFRYYPVALQLPSPTPLPTLALGIPDALISVPLPFLWKHIITVNTPFGLFVVWIALAGGIVPNPFVMFIDENNQAMFLITPKGPANIPASQLGIIKEERLSLLEFINFSDPLKISLGSPLGKLLSGSTRGNPFDPDDAATVIDNVKSKIQKTLDNLEIPDPSFAGISDSAIRLQTVLKNAIEEMPPDIAAVSEGISEVFKLVLDGVDKINIPSIQIPKNAKYTAMELPPVMELIETFSGLVESALAAPPELTSEILADIGLGAKMLDVKAAINQIARTEISKPDLQDILSNIDLEIDELEASITDSSDVEADAADVETAKKEAILKRTQKAKKMVADSLRVIADKITPETLGFVTTMPLPLDLPVPCYTNIELPPMPPWVTAALGLIKKAPSLIEAFPDEQLVDLLSGVLNLEKPLPNAESLFYAVFDKVIGILIPELILPIGFDATILKQIKDSVQNWLKTYKLRLPKPGLAVPLVIAGSLIKSLVKSALSAFLNTLKTLIINKLNEAINAIESDKDAKICAVITVIKLMLGTDLYKIKGADIKAFIKSLLESAVYPSLDTIKTLISTATAVSADFKSIKETFLPPDLVDVGIKLLQPKPPFFEIGAEQLKEFVDPLLNGLVKTLSNSIPYPVILLGCSFPASRLALTKINPAKATEKLPRWEGITLKNIPYVVWLDQLAASAQRYSLLGSDYIVPYFTPPSS